MQAAPLIYRDIWLSGRAKAGLVRLLIQRRERAVEQGGCMDKARLIRASSGVDHDQFAVAIQLRKERMEALMSRYGIDTVMVSIPKIARAIGYSPATLYGYIKGGSFFLPYRVVNGSPMVAIDDLLEWLCSREVEVASRPRRTDSRKASAINVLESRDQDEMEDEEQSNPSQTDIETARMVARALAKIGNM